VSTQEHDGRGADGRFTKGNGGGPGNPYAKRIGEFRSAVLAAVSREDMEAIVRRLVTQALDGDIQAAKEILMRTLGRPVESDLIERIERLEASV